MFMNVSWFFQDYFFNCQVWSFACNEYSWNSMNIYEQNSMDFQYLSLLLICFLVENNNHFMLVPMYAVCLVCLSASLSSSSSCWYRYYNNNNSTHHLIFFLFCFFFFFPTVLLLSLSESMSGIYLFRFSCFLSSFSILSLFHSFSAVHLCLACLPDWILNFFSVFGRPWWRKTDTFYGILSQKRPFSGATAFVCSS